MRKLLLPFTLIYMLITAIRNKLFDWGVFKSATYSKPIICVGNITVGGTGKTPCIEYLAGALTIHHRVGLVSRGYRRKTKGLVVADADSDASDIGDEPFLIKQQFPAMPVVVAEKRALAVDYLVDADACDVVLMDDGFQHRAVKAGLYIMMMDYSRPLWRDFVFPAGDMREPASGRRRAKIIIVSKCPVNINNEKRDYYTQKLKVDDDQHLFFTSIKYGMLKPFNNSKPLSEGNIKILAVSGIANPNSYHNHLQTLSSEVIEMPFGDHHNFSTIDLEKIDNQFKQVCEGTIVTITGKDAARLNSMSLNGYSFADRLYVLPIDMEFLFNEKDKFDKLINQYVNKNQ